MRVSTLLLVPVLAAPLQAQLFERLFNPDVKVALTHPPGLGLKVSRVAFLPPRNDASAELVSLLTADLATRLEVVDRVNLQAVLREQELGLQGHLEPATVARLGKLLGPSVLLTVDVHQIQARTTRGTRVQDVRDKAGKVTGQRTFHTARTRLEFRASVQAVDLETGRIFGARALRLEPEAAVESEQGRPEPPPEGPLRDQALAYARMEVARLLLPWNETRKLIFYDDKAFGMKEAYRRLEGGDVAGALAASREAYEQARSQAGTEPKHQGRTAYNVGMCHFIRGDYDEALPFLRAARDTDRDNGIYRDALQEVQRALDLREELQRVEARSPRPAEAVLPEPPARPAAEPAQPAKPSVEERLERLEALRKKGLITPAEYQQRRAEILKEL